MKNVHENNDLRQPQCLYIKNDEIVSWIKLRIKGCKTVGLMDKKMYILLKE